MTAYSKTTWVDDVTPISANNMNKIENGIEAAQNAADAAQTTANSANTLAGTKLNASSYTAADVLAKLLTVDGAGSGLDADTIDGINSSQLMRSDANTSTTGNIYINKLGGSGAITLAIGDTDTGFDWASDGNLTIKANGANVGTISPSGIALTNALSVNGTTQAQVRLNSGKLEYWNGSAWVPAGVQAAKGTAATDGSGTLTVGGLLFQPSSVFIEQSPFSYPTFSIRRASMMGQGSSGAWDGLFYQLSVGWDVSGTPVFTSFGNGNGRQPGTGGIVASASGFTCTNLLSPSMTTNWVAFGLMP